MLVYDDTLPRERPGCRPVAAFQDRTEASERSAPSIRSVYAVLRRRWLWVLAGAVVGAAVAFMAGKALPPRYTAEAQLYIDPRDLRLTDKELTPLNQDSTGYLTVVESQAQMITSSAVLSRAVKALGLANDPEFAKGSQGLIARIGIALGLSEPPEADAETDAAAALDTLARRITIRRTGRTFIVDVSAWSQDPEKAARLANGVVNAYLAEESASRAEAATRASTGLTARLAELREAVNRAEGRVQAYKVENGLVAARDVLVTDQQLTQLNAQLAAARVRAADAKARVEQLQRIQASGLDAGANEDALASQAIASMRSQYAELSRKQAELLHDLGPRHPLATSINSQVQQARRLIDQEIARYVQAARTDLARAEATVASLERSFEQAKSRTLAIQQAQIRLRELERDVEASRAIYEAFLVRARETGQQASLETGNARVITPAVKPFHRSYPPPARILGLLGFAAGLLLGIGFAFGDDHLRRDLERQHARNRRHGLDRDDGLDGLRERDAVPKADRIAMPETIDAARRNRSGEVAYASTATGGRR